MSVKGAIFDMDGTLLDSMSGWDTVASDYLRSLGVQPRENLNETFKSMTMSQMACHLQKEYGVALPAAEIIDGVNGMVERYYADEVQLKKGVAEFLSLARRKGVQMCIATATDRPLVEAALRRLKIRHYFSEIFTCTSVGYSKDEPVIFERALAFLGTPKAETVVFEDALHAVRTAKSAGFPVIAVYDPYEAHPSEVRALADHYIENFSQAEEAVFPSEKRFPLSFPRSR